MADDTLQSDIFKFVSLRPPVSADKKNQEINFISDSRKPEETPVGELVKSFNPKDGTKIPIQIKEFIQLKEYDLNYLQQDKIISEINDFIINIDKDSISNDHLLTKIEQIIDGKLSDYYSNEKTQNQLHEIWDRYYIFYMLSRTESTNLESLTRIIRIYHLIYLLTKNIKISDEKTLNNALTAKPLIPKLFIDLPKPKIILEEPKKEEENEEKVNEYKAIWANLIDTYRAIEEVRNIKFDTTLTSETKNVTTSNKETGSEEKNKLTFVKSNLVVSKKSFENLHNSTKIILSTLNLTEGNFQIAEPITQLQNKLENLYLTAYNINDANFFKHMPVEAKSIQGLSSIAGRFSDISIPFLLFPPTNIRASIKPLGIGDLKVVKQKLKKYVAGEVAHIENVLRGEYKERKHRVLDRTEDIFTVTNETDEETTKDTQTTERFELKKESEKTVQEQMSVQAGVTVSGSYGTVTFGAHGDFAYSTASQESNKSASNFAREVIDKSVSKIQKKTKEERTTKKLHEVEELNTHGIDNKEKPDHAVGIYRWVDKYYEAQIYNYGKRMMFEFIIPEPAAFYEYAKTHRPKKDIIPPIVPYKWILRDGKWVTDGIITHRDIRNNIGPDGYQNYIRDYNVKGVTPPPLPFKTISTAIVKGEMALGGDTSEKHEGNSFAMSSKELVIPTGYYMRSSPWWEMSAIWSHYPKIEITIANKIFRPFELSDPGTHFNERFLIGNNHDNPSLGYNWFWEGNIVHVSVNTYDVLSYTLNVNILVERTDEAYEQWQIQTYEKIMGAYTAMQIEYEQKLAAQEVQQGIAISGQNPRINREIEKTELKKQCIKMLMDTSTYAKFDAMGDNGKSGKGLELLDKTFLPDFEIGDAFEEGKTIQFFEQAFEWENLTYLFYPYFWARKEQWVHKSNIYDNDPLFTKFLQAGSARVVIPVRPGYNDVIAYYMQTGKIWGQDGNPPLIRKDDGSLNDLFISIADELRNQTDDLAKATPEGDSWEVVLPTTLVWLQKDSDLPTFNG